MVDLNSTLSITSDDIQKFFNTYIDQQTNKVYLSMFNPEKDIVDSARGAQNHLLITVLEDFDKDEAR